MPPRQIQLPAPANWQDFELLCRDLFAAEWDDPSAQRNGRQGQPQAGVDVFGLKKGKQVGVQCKLRDQHYGARVAVAELKEEVAKAKTFEPKLTEFVLATTAPKDVALQKAARKLSTTALRVVVMAWEDLVERLQVRKKVLTAHYAWDLPASKPKRELHNYLQLLRDKLGALPLAAIHEHRDKAPTIDRVYTALDIEQGFPMDEARLMEGAAPASVRRRRGAVAPKQQDVKTRHYESDYLRARGEYLRKHASEPEGEPADHSRLRSPRAIEFLAAHQRAVLLGPAGSGKSAFASFIAVCLANERLGPKERGLALLGAPSDDLQVADIWPHGALIPLYIELRKFVADSENFPKPGKQPDASHLIDHLCSKHAKVPLPAGFVAFLREALLADDAAGGTAGRGRGVLLLLDGFDETPLDEATRLQIKRVILAFEQAYPRCRILVTSRPYAYETSASWRLPEFAVGTLAELSPPLQATFVRSMYAGLAASGSLGTDNASPRSERLVDQVERDQHLQRLARRPLTLALLVCLHASDRLGAGGRAVVYRETIELLFDRWNQVRRDENQDRQQAEREAGLFRDAAGLDKADMMPVLRELAQQVHASEGQGIEPGEQASPIGLKRLLDAMEKARERKAQRERKPEPDRIDHVRAFEYLDKRSGILISDGDGNFRFPHRSFQEYLAACQFCEDENWPEQLVEAVRERMVLWREVMKFCVLIQAGNRAKNNVLSLAQHLLSDSCDAADNGRRATCLADAMLESGLLPSFERTSIAARVAEQLQRCLVAAVESTDLEAAARIEAGEVLGRLGDPRIGHRRENFLPIGPGAKVSLGKYLVTVQEFAEFVDAGGYRDDRWWLPDGGLAIRKENGWTEPREFGAQRRHANRPVTGVSWYEAWAYCRWRSALGEFEVRLPTAAERNQAAGSKEWPWGDGPDPNPELANYENNVGAPSPVGCYPRGCGHVGGHFDLGGNVWEWLENDGARSGDARHASVRGGSWLSVADYLRAGIDRGADGRVDGLGFRLAAPAST